MQEFIPAYYIRSLYVLGEDGDMIELENINNQTVFDFYFEADHLNPEEHTRIDAIYCSDYMSGPYANSMTEF